MFKKLRTIFRGSGTIIRQKLLLICRKIQHRIGKVTTLFAACIHFHALTGIAQTHRVCRVCAVSAQLIQRNAVKTAKAHQVKDDGRRFTGFIIRVGGTFNAKNIRKDRLRVAAFFTETLETLAEDCFRFYFLQCCSPSAVSFCENRAHNCVVSLREIQIADTIIVYAICATMHDYVRIIHTDDVYILCKLKLFSHTSIHNTHTEKCRFLTTSAECSEKQEVKKKKSRKNCGSSEF